MDKTGILKRYPQTHDGRYFVVRGRLWRCTNPGLSEQDRHLWVSRLMSARRAKKQANLVSDSQARERARLAVEEAKQALGERGPVWWTDGTPDYNRKLVVNTPYCHDDLEG